MNIDRDSFRETDVHYQALKAYVWDALRHVVFPDFKARQRDYRTAKQVIATAAADRVFEEALMQLPAPATDAGQGPAGEALLKTIRLGEDNLNVSADSDPLLSWSSLISDLELSSEARDRFQRVLRVLISSELLVGVIKDDLESVLLALAIAVK